jgi:phosphate acetyltransferase
VARSVYVAGLGPGVGKGTIALGLVEMLSRQVARIGVFRPLVSGTQDDPLLTQLTSRYPLVAP